MALLCRNQLVGARRYGRFGRYVRPAPPPDTERQALYKEAGFDTVNEERKCSTHSSTSVFDHVLT